MYLLDQSFLAALRIVPRSAYLQDWIERYGHMGCYVSVVTLAEVQSIAEKARRRNPVFARELSAWVETTLLDYADHVLPVEGRTAQVWGAVAARNKEKSANLILRATAMRHRLTIVGTYMGPGDELRVHYDTPSKLHQTLVQPDTSDDP